MPKAKLIQWKDNDGFVQMERIHFICPGCNQRHAISEAIHSFNGDFDKPTFRPSVLVTWGKLQPDWRCHSNVKDGMIQFLNDCSHELKGKTVPLPEFDEKIQ